jgi:hypothetical protein
MVCDSTRPECDVRRVEAVTWCSNADDERLLTQEEMEEVMDEQLGALLAIRA